MDEGTPFGHYRLRRLIGEGGMGQVYEAFDTRSDRVVALKVLPPHSAADPEFRERFRRESRAAAGLNDPHVIPIHQYGEIDGRMYLDMRLVQGQGVDTVLAQRGPMPPALAVSIVGQVAAALAAAHANALVHRDVKPSNMLLCADDFVYLIDFGIARSAAEAGLTSTGAAIGTFAYMSPERLAGVADIRSDVYALACVLHECLTGSQPFPGTSLEQQITAHLTSPPPRPSVVRPDVPVAFDEVIARGMSKDPAQRYQTATELATAARNALTSTADLTPAVTNGGGRPAIVAPAASPQPSFPTLTPTTVQAPVRREPVHGDNDRWWEPETVLAEPVLDSQRHSPTGEAARAPTLGNRRVRRGRVLLSLAVAAAVAVPGTWYATRPEAPEDFSASENPQVPTFKIGDLPEYVAVNPTTHTAYVGNANGGLVAVFDTVSRSVVTTIDTGQSGVRGLALDPGIHTLFTIGIGSVSMIDTASRTVTGAIRVGTSALQGIAVDPDNHTLYTSDGISMVVIDATSRAVRSSFSAGDYSNQLALDTNAHTLFATNARSGTVSTIDTLSQKVTASVKVGKTPKHVAADPTTHTAYVTNGDDGTVSVIDTVSRSVIATINIADRADGVALDPGTHTVYVTTAGGKVLVIDGLSHVVMSTIAVGAYPTDAAVDTTTHTVYVINNRGNSMSVIER
ncbi:protein kinase [Nocardia tengchongensis]|uniref:non-specific serine/threonine protein kinase n=1 Tax=Nocardia tengchongensis TaxID=2055889 RepID=A0ABX8CS65_9NOCA|nr:serine/threonine-protein kinase [Nocardia tengchongensis]QVI21908.1 protein kinase [Nocardia tengchongensis]